MMDAFIRRFEYRGSALPGNAEVVVLCATAPTYSGGAKDGNGFNHVDWLQKNDVHRVVATLQNDQSGTIKAYQSLDRGVTWVQVFPDIAVAASVANDENRFDFNVEPYPDFKLTWTNGATPQTTFRVNIVGTDQRVVAV